MNQPNPHPSPRRFVVVGLVVAGVVAAVAVTYSVLPLPASTPIPGVAAPTAGPGDASSGPQTPAQTPTPTQPGTDRERPQTPVPFVPAPLPVGPRTTTEVEANPQSDPTQPQSKPLPPLMTGDLPADAAAMQKIVAGFPAVIPIAEQSTIVASSVSSSGNRVQATLEATTTQSPARVTEYYRAAFAALSLPGASAPSTGGSSGTVFSRGADSVTLTVTPDGDGARYSLFGAINVAR